MDCTNDNHERYVKGFINKYVDSSTKISIIEIYYIYCNWYHINYNGSPLDYRFFREIYEENITN